MDQFKKMHAFIASLFFTFIFSSLSAFAQYGYENQSYSKDTLISGYDVVTPGQTFWIGWQIDLAENWHTYWKNPGDTGLKGQANWTLPKGVSVGEFHWPIPHVYETEGLVNYGYSNRVILMAEVTLDETVPVNTPLDISFSGDYLICDEICLPATANINKGLTTGQTPVANNQSQLKFQQQKAKWPQKIAPAKVNVSRDHEKYTFNFNLEGKNTPANTPVRIFPFVEDTINDAAEQSAMWSENVLELVVQRDTYQDMRTNTFGGLIVFNPEAEIPTAFGFDAPVTVTVEEKPKMQTSSTSPYGELVKKSKEIAPETTPNIALILAFSLLAGLILNLMPCVLPVLSIKVLGLIQHTHGNNGKQHALLFAAGVIVSFWVLASILIALQGAGAVLGWGFHLQNPTFVLILIFVLTLLSLNFLGVFEIGQSLMKFGNADQKHQGSKLGSFLSGVLVTIVATPCTVPFMGTAVAYALSQSSIIMLMVFTFMGAGLALPFVTLSFVPKLVSFLPKPGQWMVTFKQFLAFPLFATVLWLIWVFLNQVGDSYTIPLLVGLLIASFGAWVYGSFAKLTKPFVTRMGYLLLFLATIIVGFSLAQDDHYATASRVMGIQTNEKTSWDKWTPLAVAQAQAEGKPVFINFTADWCLTCKVNERVSLNSPKVQALFAENDVVLLKGDWTNRDNAIAAELERHNRRGVPLYLYIDKNGNEHILPQLLTFEAIKKHVMADS